MSGELFKCGYGAILQEDVDVLEKCLFELLNAGSLSAFDGVNVLEIGMHDGGTAKGIESYVAKWCRPLAYYGIDPDDGTTRPRYVPANGKVIIGDSAEVFNQVPEGLDLVWVDGCHCQNHVMLDTIHYAPKVRVGGFICYHDINPSGQGCEHQYHGPDIPEFGLAVLMALEAIKFPWPNWEFFAEKYTLEVHNCGTRAYRRIS